MSSLCGLMHEFYSGAVKSRTQSLHVLCTLSRYARTPLRNLPDSCNWYVTGASCVQHILCLGTIQQSTQQIIWTHVWVICTLSAGLSSQRSTTCTGGAFRRSLRESAIAHPTTSPSSMYAIHTHGACFTCSSFKLLGYGWGSA